MSEFNDQQGTAGDEDREAAVVEGLEATDRDWRYEYLRETAQSRKYRQRAQRAENEAEQLRSNTLDEAQLAEYTSLRQQAAEVAEKDCRIGTLEETVRKIVGINELTAALGACGVGSGCLHGDRMVSQAARLLERRICVDAGGDEPHVSVLDRSGQAMVDHEGNPVSVGAFVATWLAEEGPHFLPASGDTGSGAHSGTSGAQGPSIDQLDRDPGAKAQYIAAHGPRAYVQLARRK